MRVTVASDHAGYDLKKKVVEHLLAKGFEVEEAGATSADVPYDYVEAGVKVAEDVTSGKSDRGIAICGTGIGIAVVVNKHKGIRCGTCTNEYMARMSRCHNDANVIALGARVIGYQVALGIVDAFFEEEFAGDRHAVRVGEIKALEEKYFK